ncbi:MAG: hypothetical protein LBL31_06910, partial [Spirochaetaceae bacterium]|nr:hypothetical protein [Spirochaetaceae bacterium]
MANASKPSIFDRRAIGSEKELDEYGVWLKSESEELAVLEQDGSEDYNFPPFEEKSGPAADAYEEHTSVSDVSDATAAISGTSNPEATLSATLLLKIAEELALIKNELAALKSEVDRIHNERETSVPPPAVPVPSVPRPVADNLPAETEVTKDENAKVGFEDAGAREEKAAEYAAVVSEPVTEEPAAAVDEAAFDIFDGADTEDFAAEEKTANVENIPPEKDAAEAGTDFFGADKPDDETALSSGEQDLLGGDAAKNVDGNVEAPEDSFFAGGQDEEKSAVPGDAINGILSDLEIPAETALNEDAKVAETAFEDIPGEPASAESAAQPEAAASVPDEDLAIDGGAVDITSEAAEEAASDEPAALEAEAAGSLEE